MNPKDGRPMLTEAAENFAHAACAHDTSGHDWWHIHRVRNLAVRIARAENADVSVAELAALLHDVDDWKLSGSTQPVKARAFLTGQQAAPDLIAQVCQICSQVSFKGAGVPTPMPTLEGQCVQDADRLDALGAIGIGRTFAYGGHKGRPLHDPAYKPELHQSFEAYQKGRGTAIAHFHEKLLLLKDLMQTPSGRQLAQARHAYLEGFLKQFHTEWDGLA